MAKEEKEKQNHRVRQWVEIEDKKTKIVYALQQLQNGDTTSIGFSCYPYEHIGSTNNFAVSKELYCKIVAELETQIANLTKEQEAI